MSRWFSTRCADHIRAIAKIQLQGLAERLADRELTLEISDAVFEQLSRVALTPCLVHGRLNARSNSWSKTHWRKRFSRVNLIRATGSTLRSMAHR